MTDVFLGCLFGSAIGALIAQLIFLSAIAKAFAKWTPKLIEKIDEWSVNYDKENDH